MLSEVEKINGTVADNELIADLERLLVLARRGEIKQAAIISIGHSGGNEYIVRGNSPDNLRLLGLMDLTMNTIRGEFILDDVDCADDND